MKVYQVMVIDVWNNITHLGFYKNLDDAVPDINELIWDEKYHIRKGEVKEYPSTMDWVFDTNLYDIITSRGELSEDELETFENSDDYQIQIRGFIFDLDYLDETVKEIIVKNNAE